MTYPQPVTWDSRGLLDLGFSGFVPLTGMDAGTLPPHRGIYVILREGAAPPAFVADNPITRRRPYSIGELQSKWVANQSVVYIGKADAIDGIRGRLGAFSRQSSGHTGGRGLWQLADAFSLTAAWMATPDYPSALLETDWLKSFKSLHGAYPFANWRG